MMKDKVYGNYTIKQVGGFFDKKYKLYDGDIPISTSLNASKQEMNRLIKLAKELESIRLLKLGDDDVQD